MAGGVLCVLFTDLVGSTELMTRLGDLAFDQLRSQHFAELRDVIAAGGGTEIKNTGDGLLATFTSAVEALGAAAGAEQATARQGRSAGVTLSLRVGLALGEVTLDDGDVFGTPVVEAARLVARAGPGQILATGLVRAVAGSRSGATFTELGNIELKGLPEPVAVWEVGWKPLSVTAAVPLPGLVLRPGRLFVGREGEMAALQARWKDVEAGARSLVLLGGEPGIGKTRLAAELAARVHDEGGTVLAGRCDEDMGVPYQPFVEALRHYVAHAPAPIRLGRHAGELARLVPELPQLVAGLPEPLRSDPETERYRLFDALSGWLADATAETPVLLVLDDLQWAAKPTVLLLRHLLRAPDPARLLLLATHRDTDQSSAFADFLADLSRLEDAERMTVTGLTVDGVAAFLEAAGGRALDAQGAALAEVVWRETEGNCFFVAEVLRHLSESGALEQRDGRWVSSGSSVPIPEGVRDVISRRLARLSEDTNRMLAGASVIGLEFDIAVVQAAGGFDEDTAVDALEAATGARLIVEVPAALPRYRFSHSLVRTTLYERLSAARRQSLHRRTAEAIEMIQLNHLDDHLPALAHHWSQAGVAAKAADYARRAADRALVQLAHDEAAALYAQALALTAAEDDDATRTELLISLGDAQRRAGNPDHRETLLAAAALAERRGDADALARAALSNSRLYFSGLGIFDQERIDVIEKALAATGGTVSPTRARLFASLAVELVWTVPWERRADLSNEALRLARDIGDADTLAVVLVNRFYAINAPENLSDRIADAVDLVELSGRLADPVLRFMAEFIRARAAIESGDADELAAHLPKAEALAAEVGQPTFRWMVGWLTSARLLLAGSVGDAETAVSANLALGTETGQPDAERLYLLQLAAVRYEQGRLGELEPKLSELSARLPAIPQLASLAALAACQLGEDSAAGVHHDRLRAISFEMQRHPLGLSLLCVATEVARHLGDLSSAERLYERLAPYPSSFGLLAASPTGCTAYYLGVLANMTARYDAAEDHFRQGSAIYERVGAPAFLARLRTEWARMLLTRRGLGDVEEARALLDRATTTAAELELVEVEHRASAVVGEML
jgi:class 3 adenylate cyclase